MGGNVTHHDAHDPSELRSIHLSSLTPVLVIANPKHKTPAASNRPPSSSTRKKKRWSLSRKHPKQATSVYSHASVMSPIPAATHPAEAAHSFEGYAPTEMPAGNDLSP